MSQSDPSQARAISAGGVILRRAEGVYETVVVGRKREGTWLLPKGTPRDREPLERTAQREVSEETGLDVRILSPIGTVYYTFEREGRRIEKTVLFYLMAAVGGDVREHDHEYDVVQWVPLEEARRLLTFGQYRDLLDRAVMEYQRLGYG